MPPQPLSNMRFTGTFSLGSMTISDHRDLGSIVMEIISFGAHTKYEWSGILVHLLRADPQTGMAMYEAVISSEARRQMLLSAAEVALQKDDWVLFQAVIKAISPARRTRNDFAHHVWGSAAQIPDALLLVDPKYLTHYDVEVAVINAEMLTSRSIVTLPDLDMSLLMVWKRRDLEEARQIAKEALVITRELREGLDLSAPGLEIGGGTRQRLLNRPSIAQAFRRLADLTRSPEMPPLRG